MGSFLDPDHRGAGLVIVAEQCTFRGGSERVIDAAAARWPDADVIAPHFVGEPERGDAPPWRARAGTVDLPGNRRHFLAPLHARRLGRLGPAIDADAVLAFHSNGWALGARVVPGAPVVAYTTGPARWLYRDPQAYLRDYPLPARLALRAALPLIRRSDRRLLMRADSLLCCSAFAARELARVHGRSAEIVYPPVALVDSPAPARRRGGHVLAVARLTHHKLLHVLLEAVRGLGRELVVVGTGAEDAALRRQAPANVTFTGWVSDEDLAELYRSASVFACPGSEEFGITMVEAHAFGLPVVAPRAGGAVEIVEDGVTGVLLDEVTPVTLRAGLLAAGSLPHAAAAYRASAARFTTGAFVQGVGRALDAAVAASRASALTESTSAANRSSGRVVATPDAAARPAASARSHA